MGLTARFSVGERLQRLLVYGSIAAVSAACGLQADDPLAEPVEPEAELAPGPEAELHEPEGAFVKSEVEPEPEG